VELSDPTALEQVLALANEARHGPLPRRCAALESALRLLALPAGPDATPEQLRELLELALGRPERRLAVYGSLRRGRSNHGLIADLVGTWHAGLVRGRLDPAAAQTGGYPTLAPDPRGTACAVELFECDALPQHWARLDAFEGAAYRRVLAPVELAGAAPCVANLYAPASG